VSANELVEWGHYVEVDLQSLLEDYDLSSTPSSAEVLCDPKNVPCKALFNLYETYGVSLEAAGRFSKAQICWGAPDFVLGRGSAFVECKGTRDSWSEDFGTVSVKSVEKYAHIADMLGDRPYVAIFRNQQRSRVIPCVSLVDHVAHRPTHTHEGDSYYIVDTDDELFEPLDVWLCVSLALDWNHISWWVEDAHAAAHEPDDPVDVTGPPESIDWSEQMEAMKAEYDRRLGDLSKYVPASEIESAIPCTVEQWREHQL